MNKLLFLCLLILFTNTSQATQIRVVTEDIAPYQFINEQGQLDGFCADVVNAMLLQAKQTAEINVLTWARAYDIALRLPNIMIFSLARTPEREQKFHWIGKITEEHLFLWGTKQSFPEPIDNIQQLTPYKVATTRSSYAEQLLRKQGFNSLHFSTKEDLMLLMLYEQRVDLIVGTKVAIKALTQKLNLDFHALRPLLHIIELDSSLNIAMSMGSDPQMISIFRQAFNDISNNGILANIKEKWQM